MKFRRIGTNLIYDVKESLIPLYLGNEAYVKVEDADKNVVNEAPQTEKKTRSRKK